MKNYRVLRAHQGDKWYAENATRSAHPMEVAHLVRQGVLIEAKPENSQAPARKAVRSAPKNKAVKSAPRNKAG